VTVLGFPIDLLVKVCVTVGFVLVGRKLLKEMKAP
jgi:hypothetical protein